MTAEMMLFGENGRPSAAERIDKNRWVEDHERSRAAYQMLTSPCAMFPFLTVLTSVAEEYITASAPLSSLTTITIPELILGRRHHGRVLYGRLCVKPYKVTSVKTVLEDSTGHYAIRLSMYNVLSSTASSREVESCFPLGMRLAIKEPLYKLCLDGKSSLRVDNPTDIVPDKGNEDESDSPPCLSNPETIEENLKSIRREGNRLFEIQNWVAAAKKYSQCIDLAGPHSSKLSHIVILAFSNRAETMLRLQNFDCALRDADKALELDPKHAKTLVRKGKAAHGLGLFEKASTAFRDALIQSPEHSESISENLKASITFYEQSQHGKYKLSKYYSRGYTSDLPMLACDGDIPSFADFMGPVEIRRVTYGCGKRGLFATRGIEGGELILVSNPMAISRVKADLSRLFLNVQLKVRGSSNGNVYMASQQELVKNLANRVMKSKRTIAQLYSLAVYGKHEMEVPSMELFKSGSEWVPPIADKLDVDVGHIRDIVKLNSFGINVHTDLSQGGKLENHISGLWVLPSFANHSCAPNCSIIFIGDAMFIRASRNILDGEELTVAYFNPFETMEARQANAKNRCFTCACERCGLEVTLKPRLLRISKNFLALVEAAIVGDAENCWAEKELVKLTQDIEEVIVNLDHTQQNWIRGAYVYAYLSKTILSKVEHTSSQSRSLPLEVVVDCMTAICIDPSIVKMAARLLYDVKQTYSKGSQTYKLAEEKVLGIYKIAFADEPKKILHKLIRSDMER